VRSILLPLSRVYGAGVALRLALYERGVFKVRCAHRPVVSVGNVASGGTGKTPFVRWLAGELLRRGRHPSVLTRGYGRTSRGTVVVSDGRGALASVAASGDEPALLALALPSVPIVADARRALAAARAETLEAPVDVHLLDDGFSHVGLAREVDIVLLDAAAPEAGGALLPAGLLREPLTALARADLIVVTKTEAADPAAALEIARRYAPGVPVFHARTVILGIRDRDGTSVDPSDLPAGTTVAVAGIARPGSFRATLQAAGIDPTDFLAFRDHEAYGPGTVGRIERALEETGATAVVTTEKDAVKLDSVLRAPVFRVAVEARVVEPSFVSEVLSLLSRRPS
jgi:tetraacyldisaccharide 4'-kinase